MGAFRDLTGQRFGRLTALERVVPGEYYSNTSALWRCRCDCGTETLVFSNNLRNGETRSCGCLRRETSRENGRRRHKPK